MSDFLSAKMKLIPKKDVCGCLILFCIYINHVFYASIQQMQRQNGEIRRSVGYNNLTFAFE